MGTGFIGGKVGGAWRGVDHPPPSSAEVKETVQLYLYSPSGPNWPVEGLTVPSPFPLFSSLYVRANEKPEPDLTLYMVEYNAFN